MLRRRYEPTYEAVAERLGEAFAPVFDAGCADARSGRALTPDDRGARG